MECTNIELIIYTNIYNLVLQHNRKRLRLCIRREFEQAKMHQPEKKKYTVLTLWSCTCTCTCPCPAMQLDEILSGRKYGPVVAWFILYVVWVNCMAMRTCVQLRA